MGSLRRKALALAGAVLVAACGGGRVTVPCDEERCNADCVAQGAESGACRADSCVCVRPIDIPGGLQHGFSSGGAVERQSGSYRLSITVGPVSVGGTAATTTGDLELGIAPMTDPERLVPPAADGGTP